ncbi:MAG: glycoside hydrolase family 5 protein [Oscillospiraceae bacterium]|jgi:endoglucanase|nr:glycoside hydrolase family 5 protein [Oscillospiraceae bacterium]
MQKGKFLRATAILLALGLLPACGFAGELNTTAPFETALETAGKMGIGWNLGNTFDAIGNARSGVNSETAWGNPKTTEALIKAVKDAGFDTVRIPITWLNHFDSEYKIDEAWLERVKTVVQYVTDNGMYAIINMHHDGQAENGWLKPTFTGDEREAMVDQFTTLWAQIAEYFKDCGGNVLFAGMNEFHDGYYQPYPQDFDDLTNRLNQAFVDTVRATGGNNATRILIFQTYNTLPEAAPRTTVPTDATPGYLMLEAHYYQPWTFAGEGGGKWGSDGNKLMVDLLCKQLKRNFVDKGIPVVMGEYGAVITDNPDRIEYIRYVTEAFVKSGIIPCWWDNGYLTSGNELFGLMDRATDTVGDPVALEAIMAAKSQATPYDAE